MSNFGSLPGKAGGLPNIVIRSGLRHYQNFTTNPPTLWPMSKFKPIYCILLKTVNFHGARVTTIFQGLSVFTKMFANGMKHGSTFRLDPGLRNCRLFSVWKK